MHNFLSVMENVTKPISQIQDELLKKEFQWFSLKSFIAIYLFLASLPVRDRCSFQY